MQIPTFIYPQYKIQQTVNNKRIFFFVLKVMLLVQISKSLKQESIQDDK